MNKESKEKIVNIKILPHDFWLYSYPMILAFHGKAGKRIEAGKWSLEVKKMLNGIVRSVEMMENLMNNYQNKEKVYIGKKQVELNEEDTYWMLIYFIDNSILRVYACLDKMSQMCRSYFEHVDNGSNLKVYLRCGCEEKMNDKNCSFGNLVNSLINENPERNKIIAESLKKLDKNSSISKLRGYRNMFTHREHRLDHSVGLNPDVKVDYQEVSEFVNFTFGKSLPSVNWFRVEIVKSHNAIIDCLAEIWGEIFPADFKINRRR